MLRNLILEEREPTNEELERIELGLQELYEEGNLPSIDSLERCEIITVDSSGEIAPNLYLSH